MDTNNLSLDSVERLIVALVKAGGDAFVQGLIERIPPTAIRHGRVTLGMIRHLLDQTGGHTNLPEEILAQINRVETAVGPMSELLIDCDEAPADLQVIGDWRVSKHQSGGKIIWNPELFRFHFSPAQIKGQAVTGETIWRQLRSNPEQTLNVCVLKWLLEHQQHIPADWRTKQIGFFGTIYIRPYPGYSRAVNWLYWENGGWLKNLGNLESTLQPNCPAIVYKTPPPRVVTIIRPIIGGFIHGR